MNPPCGPSIWFAGQLILESGCRYYEQWIFDSFYSVMQDRVGSVRGTSMTYSGGVAGPARYYPYGDEITSTTNERTKFGTYYRDSFTGVDYADQRYYASLYGRFLTPDQSGTGLEALDPGTWNRYGYAYGDPVDLNDPEGKCPPGYVPATTAAQLQGIVSTTESYVLPPPNSLSHANGTHYVAPGGVLSAIDCSGLIAQALAGIGYTATGFQAANSQDQFTTSQIPNLFAAATSWQVGDIISFGSHAGIVTGVSSTGQVTSFVGSQTSSGPANVTIANSPYWAKRLSTAKSYTPCVPAGAQQASTGDSTGPSIGGGLQPVVDAFLAWVDSIPLGGGGGDGREQVTESIAYDF